MDVELVVYFSTILPQLTQLIFLISDEKRPKYRIVIIVFCVPTTVVYIIQPCVLQQARREVQEWCDSGRIRAGSAGAAAVLRALGAPPHAALRAALRHLVAAPLQPARAFVELQEDTDKYVLFVCC